MSKIMGISEFLVCCLVISKSEIELKQNHDPERFEIWTKSWGEWILASFLNTKKKKKILVNILKPSKYNSQHSNPSRLVSLKALNVLCRYQKQWIHYYAASKKYSSLKICSTHDEFALLVVRGYIKHQSHRWWNLNNTCSLSYLSSLTVYVITWNGWFWCGEKRLFILATHHQCKEMHVSTKLCFSASGSAGTSSIASTIEKLRWLKKCKHWS